MDATWNAINSKYYFRGGRDWTRQKVRDCLICTQKRSIQLNHNRAPLKTIPVTPKLFWRVHVDLAGPFPKSRNGNTFIALAYIFHQSNIDSMFRVCAFCKYVEAWRKRSCC